MADLVDVELDYCCGSMTVGEIACRYGISPDDLQKLARAEGWPITGIIACNEQRQRFVDAYCVSLKPHLAAREAGYTGRDAGATLMRNPEVILAIQARMRARAARSRITQDEVIAELGKIALSNVRDLYDADGNLLPVHQLPEEVAAAIAMIEVVEGKNEVLSTKKVKLHDKKSALDTLAKHLGMLTEKVEMTGKDGAPLVPPSDDKDVARRVAFLLAKGLRETQA